MSGSGAQKRQHADAIQAAKMNSAGWTTRNIAEALGKRPEQIKGLVLLGKRLQQVKEPK